MSKPLDLTAIRTRAAAATPGPWTVGGMLHPWEVCVSFDLPVVELWDTPRGCADAEFIAHARRDVPDLLAEVDRLRAEVDRLRGAACTAEAIPPTNVMLHTEPCPVHKDQP